VKISAKEIEGRKIPPMKKRRPSTIFQVSKILKRGSLNIGGTPLT
jgi:hypothetical protein